MKLSILSTGCLALVSGALIAEASLKHASADAFAALADLTRPVNERQSSVSLKSITQRQAGHDSKSLGYTEEGVAWTVKDVGADGGDASGLSLIPSSGSHDSLRASELVNELNELLRVPNSPAKVDQAEVHQSTLKQRASVVTLQPGQTSESTFTPLNPPSIPLAVKSPYLSAWLPSGNFFEITPPNYAGNGGYLAGQWPAFWTSSHGAPGSFRLGWTGYIRVDNTTYQWMGAGFGSIVRAGKNANQLSFTYTSTRSIFTFEAAGVRFNVTFMSPVWPNDYMRHSIPLSYLHFELDKNTAAGRSVQMYTDIDERWATAHDYDYDNYPYTVQWVDNANGSSIYFVQRTNPQTYTEFHQRAEWGSATYAMRNRKGMTARNNNNVRTQREFLTRGNVSNEHTAVGGPDNSFSYSVDFDGGKGGYDALFAIGHIRNPYVNYIKLQKGTNDTSGKPTSYLEDRYGYWMSKYPNFSDLVAFFLDDFENATKHCIALDQQIDEDSRKAVGGGDVGARYSAITQLSLRQSFATLEITIPYISSKKRYNTSDVIVFLKEISSNGDMQTVDVFAPQFPMLTYLNPELLRDVMRPIFEYTESGLYPNKWCVHDLGTYPSAFGHNDGKDEPMQVEESGNMIVLALHYAQLVDKNRAVSWLSSHYKIMQQWAEFLITDSLVPALQLSTDDFAGTLANQTNLAMKGITGISAMGYIADMLGRTKDAKRYHNVSETYIQQFYSYAINKNNTHVKLAYQTDDSWGTLYNLVFDRLLNLRLVAKEIYDKQDAFYPTKAEKYGTPLDSRYTWAKTDWQMWASATAGNLTTRDYWINMLDKFVSDGLIDAPFSDLYQTMTGDLPKEPATPVVTFIARPVVGGHFIHLAMQKANAANNVTDYAYGPPIKRKGSRKEDEPTSLNVDQNTVRTADHADERQANKQKTFVYTPLRRRQQ